ncbi:MULTISPECIES: hypothetical protein [unclassified Streptomyces]|uniref:hypothetical protein n=1 Tax=unclassified Streptomyces TaxID=2593676 RepID=UPI00035E6AE2|nr:MULTISPECIES: hypothetical protein [unclassified Streptomyces]MYT29941.1 hypothetical protein [Streptomyces sp. SID8354]
MQECVPGPQLPRHPPKDRESPQEGESRQDRFDLFTKLENYQTEINGCQQRAQTASAEAARALGVLSGATLERTLHARQRDLFHTALEQAGPAAADGWRAVLTPLAGTDWSTFTAGGRRPSTNGRGGRQRRRGGE